MTSAHFFGQGIQGQYKGAPVNWVADAIYVGLLGASYTPDLDKHKLWSDVSKHEVGGIGYTRGGRRLAATSVTHDERTHSAILSAGSVTWGPTATFTPAYAVVYRFAAPKVLIGLVDFGGAQTVTIGTFLVRWDGTLGEISV